ncbi:DUF542 domain-containing protein [uncultured Paludibaculum sp.]|uniref:DUF542 domain-containing protein n=1 Tax=uncultured Paludibaculum sp. TaxID=1765020 RepID=UPI002AAB5015|nr:DUF542 domain-containing protein [uncultured Paludibaculum sp.]
MNQTAVAGTVGEWTARNFRCVVVVEKYGIDFHEEASVPLEEACRQRGLDLDAVLSELQSAAEPRQAVAGDWANVPLRALTKHINARHHEYLKLELPRLRQRLDRMATRHGARDAGLLSRLHTAYCNLQEELELHLHKEEMILFPTIDRYESAAENGYRVAAPPFGSVRNPIQMMLREHDGATETLRQIRVITRDYVPADYACANFRAVFASLEELEADLLEHIRVENEFLFPRAAELEKSLLG